MRVMTCAMMNATIFGLRFHPDEVPCVLPVTSHDVSESGDLRGSSKPASAQSKSGTRQTHALSSVDTLSPCLSKLRTFFVHVHLSVLLFVSYMHMYVCVQF